MIGGKQPQPFRVRDRHEFLMYPNHGADARQCQQRTGNPKTLTKTKGITQHTADHRPHRHPHRARGIEQTHRLAHALAWGRSRHQSASSRYDAGYKPLDGTEDDQLLGILYQPHQHQQDCATKGSAHQHHLAPITVGIRAPDRRGQHHRKGLRREGQPSPKSHGPARGDTHLLDIQRHERKYESKSGGG